MFLYQRHLIRNFRINWRSLCTEVKQDYSLPKPVLKLEIEKENEAGNNIYFIQICFGEFNNNIKFNI